MLAWGALEGALLSPLGTSVTRGRVTCMVKELKWARGMQGGGGVGGGWGCAYELQC